MAHIGHFEAEHQSRYYLKDLQKQIWRSWLTGRKMLRHLKVYDPVHREKSTFKVEYIEWERVNKDLRQYGLPPIELTHPSRAGRISDLVLLEPEMSSRLRETVKNLMRDCDRRQTLIQDMLRTNNQLRDELQQQTEVSEKHATKTRDLNVILNETRGQVQNLESEVLNSSRGNNDEEEKLRNTNAEIKARNQQLKSKCVMYEDEINRLKNKVKRMIEDDEKRLLKQSEMFQSMRKRSVKGSLDDKVIEMVDTYEREIMRLRNILEEHGITSPAIDDSKQQSSDSLKGLIHTYEKQLQAKSKKMRTLENEVEMLKLELEGRPDIQDLRQAQIKIKTLDRIVKKHNLNVSDESWYSKHSCEGKKYSTTVDDLEYLPAPKCRLYLKTFSDTLGVSDLENIGPLLQKSFKAIGVQPKLEQFAKEVLGIVDSEGVPRPTEFKSKPPTKKPHAVWCEKTWHHVLPTLEYWALQLKSLQELQQSINRLNSILIPWKDTKLTGEATTTSLIEAVDFLTYEETEQGADKIPIKHGRLKETATKAMLQGIVEHFMNLFDVHRLSGCYATMSDTYAKFGELHNVIKTLKNVLDLPEDAKPNLVLDTVSRLCEGRDAVNSSTYHEIKQLLEVEELDSITQRLQEHEEFFPVFQSILHKLMGILGVHRVEQILPAVRILKLMTET